MNKEQVFSVAIRVVFLFAFGAFLFASIHHIATFFDNFEQDSGNWFGSYALAISIDATALVLTIGVMFFRRNMPAYAQVFVWFFIFALTAFSWLVNWEYALRFQSDMLTNNATLKFINPILASSFAFLNLAYSLVSEFFSARVQTSGDLEAEAARLESLIDAQNRINTAKEQLRKPSLIQRAKETAKELKSAAKEVVASGDEPAQEEVLSESETEVHPEVESVVIDDVEEPIANGQTEVEELEDEQENEPSTDPEMEAANVTHFPETARKTNAKTTVPLNVIDIATRRKPLTLSEAVQVLGVSEKTVREWKRSGKLSTVQNGKFFTASSVRKMLESRVKVS